MPNPVAAAPSSSMVSPTTSTTSRAVRIVVEGAVWNNVVSARLLALCPMLAVSVSAGAAAVLGGLTAAVMAAAGFLVAAARGLAPRSVRLPVFLVVVAALVGAADLLAAAFAPVMHRQLGIFLPLVITNCAVLARLEIFAARQAPLPALLDGAASGLGMTAILVALALLRQAAAALGLHAALLPAGGFILFALLLAAPRLLPLPLPPDPSVPSTSSTPSVLSSPSAPIQFHSPQARSPRPAP